MSQQESLHLIGPAGKIEAIQHWPLLSSDNPYQQHAAVICHPHPLHGGTMHNKVVLTLTKIYLSLGIRVIRFNYRGVGASEGSFAQGRGEADDARSVRDWLLANQDIKYIHLSGFSFGSYVAYQLASIDDPNSALIKTLVTVAPAVHHGAFQSMAEPTCDWIVVASMQDEIVPWQDVSQWLSTLQHPTTLLCMQDASHFFHGQLVTLREQLTVALLPLLERGKGND